MVNRHIPCMLVPDTVWLSRPCCSFFSYRISVDKKRDFYFPIVSVDHCCRVVLTCHFLMPGYKPQRATSGFAIVRGDEQMLNFSISVLSLVQNSSDGSLWPHHRKAAGRCTQLSWQLLRKTSSLTARRYLFSSGLETWIKWPFFKKIICGQSSVERWKNGRLLNLCKSMDFACAAWTRVDTENGCSLL